MSVDAKRCLFADRPEPIERRQRHGHVISNALHIDDDPMRLLVENPAAKVGDHDPAGR
jgi:hypothetical protein